MLRAVAIIIGALTFLLSIRQIHSAAAGYLEVTSAVSSLLALWSVVGAVLFFLIGADLALRQKDDPYDEPRTLQRIFLWAVAFLSTILLILFNLPLRAVIGIAGVMTIPVFYVGVLLAARFIGKKIVTGKSYESALNKIHDDINQANLRVFKDD